MQQNKCYFIDAFHIFVAKNVWWSNRETLCFLWGRKWILDAFTACRRSAYEVRCSSAHIQLKNGWTGFHEIWCGRYAIRVYSKIVIFNFLQLMVIMHILDESSRSSLSGDAIFSVQFTTHKILQSVFQLLSCYFLYRASSVIMTIT